MVPEDSNTCDLGVIGPFPPAYEKPFHLVGQAVGQQKGAVSEIMLPCCAIFFFSYLFIRKFTSLVATWWHKSLWLMSGRAPGWLPVNKTGQEIFSEHALLKQQCRHWYLLHTSLLCRWYPMLSTHRAGCLKSLQISFFKIQIKLKILYLALHILETWCLTI